MKELTIIESVKLIDLASMLTNTNIIGIQLFDKLYVHDRQYWRRMQRDNTIKWNHENIHFSQARELLFVGFYVLYFVNWVWNLIRYKFDRKKAYKNILFEIEAYKYEGIRSYLKQRKRYSWLQCRM